MAKTSDVPWKRPNPRLRAGKKSKHLSAAKKSAAKARARQAGRPYPNLVDNMRMSSTTKRTTQKQAAKTRAAKTKDGRAAAKKSSTPSRKRTTKARAKK